MKKSLTHPSVLPRLCRLHSSFPICAMRPGERAANTYVVESRAGDFIDKAWAAGAPSLPKWFLWTPARYVRLGQLCFFGLMQRK